MVTQGLSSAQRIEHEAVRILHHEHTNAPLSIPVSSKPTPSPSPPPSKTTPVPSKSPIKTRSEYWVAQATLLVSILVAGTEFDIAMEESAPITIKEMLPEGTLGATDGSTVLSNTKRHERLLLDPLLLDHLHSVTNMLYDHHLTRLEHRRAIINCARYVSARVDEVLGAVIQEPDSTLTCTYSVSLGSYLTVVASGYEENEDQIDAIPPPSQLISSFQVMLWHRCMSDLIALYSSIQSRHVANKKPVSGKSRSMPTLPTLQELTGHKHDHRGDRTAYPFCCSAHSLVFAQPSYKAAPIKIREIARRTVQVLRNVSLKSFWASDPAEDDPARRNIQPVVGSKLRFCHQEQQQDRLPKRPFLRKGLPRRQSDSDLETTKRRSQLRQLKKQAGGESRATIEDRGRLDTLKKQELLSLCHMACGLFLTGDRDPETGPSLAALLRTGSPWNKGVWREGEWHKSPIADKKVDVDDPFLPIHGSSSRGGPGHTTRSGRRIRSKLGGLLSLSKSRRGDDDESDKQGRWQQLCLAAIRFLAHEELSWGGNKRNVELSHLKTANHSDAWTYHS
ncbi:hypothetical protein BGZ74_001900 [Mortierella antarctica]|nr:hypothetical protein BGZ74_001900 [Mortierella antarctica]